MQEMGKSGGKPLLSEALDAIMTLTGNPSLTRMYLIWFKKLSIVAIGKASTPCKYLKFEFVTPSSIGV